MHFGGPDEASRRFVDFYRALSFKNARARCPNAVQPRIANGLQTPQRLLCGCVVGQVAGDEGQRQARGMHDAMPHNAVSAPTQGVHAMTQTYEAVLQPNGQLQFLDLATTALLTPQRVLVTFTQEIMQEAGPVDTTACGATLSEAALAQDWLRDEEDAAWAHLQVAR